MKQKELEFDFFKYKINYKKKIRNYFSSFLFSSLISFSYFSLCFFTFGHLLFVHYQGNYYSTSIKIKQNKNLIQNLENTPIHFSPISEKEIQFIYPYLKK